MVGKLVFAERFGWEVLGEDRAAFLPGTGNRVGDHGMFIAGEWLHRLWSAPALSQRPALTMAIMARIGTGNSECRRGDFRQRDI